MDISCDKQLALTLVIILTQGALRLSPFNVSVDGGNRD